MRITGVAACARRGLVRRIANKPPHCGHRSRLAYALTHLTSARTAGVRCAMKCLVRRKTVGVRCSVCVSEPQLYQSARKPLAPATCRLAVRIVYKPHSSVTVRALHMRSLISQCANSGYPLFAERHCSSENSGCPLFCRR